MAITQTHSPPSSAGARIARSSARSWRRERLYEAANRNRVTVLKEIDRRPADAGS